jgi:hypothetical protein
VVTIRVSRVPTTRILPPAKELAARLEQDHHLTLTALAAEYGVSRQAVKKAIDKAQVTVHRPQPHSLKHFVPWRVKVIHEQHLNVRMLRLYGRQQLGLEIPKDRRKKFEEWIRDMDLLNLVVTYSPETGFGVDERREGDERYWRP